MIKLIIFDYDGVIVDSFVNVYEVYKIICTKLGKIFPRNIEEFRKEYLKGYKQFEKNLCFSDEDQDKAEVLYKELIMKKSPEMFVGIDSVIKELSKKYIITLVSASYQEEVVNKLNAFKLDKYFKEIIGKVILDKEPLHKDVKFLEIMKNFNVKGDEVLVIGDRQGDYENAVKVGIKKVILVEYGWGFDKESCAENSCRQARRYF